MKSFMMVAFVFLFSFYGAFAKAASVCIVTAIKGNDVSVVQTESVTCDGKRARDATFELSDQLAELLGSGYKIVGQSQSTMKNNEVFIVVTLAK